MLARPMTITQPWTLASRGSRASRTMATATATATKGKEVLPLKGIKVLDMTRVLAGVSLLFLFFLFVVFFNSLLFFWFLVSLSCERRDEVKDLGRRERNEEEMGEEGRATEVVNK